MYKLSTNGKYHLLVKDLGITISYENKKAVYLSDEQFNSSNDIKLLQRYLHIEKVESKDSMNDKNDQLKNVSETEQKKTDKVFVSNAQVLDGNPDGTFVKDVNDEILTASIITDTEKDIPTSETKVENAKEEKSVEENLTVDTTEEIKNEIEKNMSVETVKEKTEEKVEKSKKKAGRPAKNKVTK